MKQGLLPLTMMSAMVSILMYIVFSLYVILLSSGLFGVMDLF